MLLRHVMGLGEIAEEAVPLADIDGDGALTALDPLMLLRLIMGLLRK